MAEAYNPDIRTWEPEERRTVSIGILVGAGVLLVAALLYFGLDATGSGWFLWVAIVALVLLLVAELAVVATGIAREEGGPEWLAGPGAATAATATAGPATEPPQPEETTHEEHAHIDLQCPECGDLFSVHDTGERPLHTMCPHCGAEGHVDLGPPPQEQAGATEPAAEPSDEELWGAPAEDEPEPAPEPDREPISLKCPACDTQFDVEDTGERPLKTTCPGCGRSGKLK